MKNPVLRTSQGIPLALSTLCDTCHTTAIEDAVADSSTGEELVRKLNNIQGLFYNNFVLDRESDTTARLKTVDCWGNTSYLHVTKEPQKAKGKGKEQQLATHITNAINCSFDYKAFVEQMSREHRALQSDFTTLCLEWLLKCREMYEVDSFDGRNKHACQTGKVLMDYLDKGKF